MHQNFSLTARQSACVLRWPLVLCASVCAPYALAQDISTETTEPVTTSTIDNGAPGDITITEDGSITLSGTEGQVAVTMDSDNNITHNGEIDIEDTDNVTGIQLNADRTGDLIMGGTINLIEDYTREDDDDDDDLDGPFALGDSRFGILLDAGGTHTGDIDLQTGSSIFVEGNNSAGIWLGSALDGAFTLDGTISVVGDESVALEIDNGVTGDVLISGNIAAQGANSRGMSIDGDVGGNLTIESAITTSGFASTVVSNYVAPLDVTDDTVDVADRIDAEDLNDNGAALAIGGNLANGLLINGSVDQFNSDEDEADEVKDTVDDFDENRSEGSITSVGSAPAVLISPDLDGAATASITLGPVVETVRDTTDDDEDEDLTEVLATFTYDYGLINRGTIFADGQNIGFDATALRIEGSADGNFVTGITGGLYNSGEINAEAFEADTTAISLGAGAIVGTFLNEGTVASNSTTIAGHEATAVLIEDGADLTSLNNAGLLTARVFGESGNAYAIRDLSGGLTQITNTGSISAALAFDGTEIETFGVARAVDVSASAADVTYLQEFATPTDDVNDDDVLDSNDVDTPSLVGDIVFGSGNDQLVSTAGTMSGDVYFGLGNGVMDLQSTTFDGDVRFTDGTNTLSLLSSTFTGDAIFGGTSASFDLNNSVFTGALVSDGALDTLTAVDSDLILSEGTSAVLNAFSLTGDSILHVDISPNPAEQVTSLTVTGMATLGEGVSIRPDLQGISATDFTHTFVDAGTLSFAGTLDESAILETPFLYNVELIVTDDVRDTLDLQFALKTTGELGLDFNQAAAFEAVLDLFSSDAELGAAMADITEEGEFQQVYSMLLPQRTDAATRYLSTQGSAAFGALNNRLKVLSSSEERPSSLWAQEYFNLIDIDADTDVPGYNGSGLGFATGIDRRVGPIDVAGIYLNYSSGEFEEKTGGNNPVSTSAFGIGLYAKESLGPLDFAIASQISSVDFTSRREIEFGDLQYDQLGDWKGTSAMTSASVGSEFEAGQFYARPQISVDFFELQQDGYTESGDDRLALEISDADTERTSATAVLALGTRLPVGRGAPTFIIPELSLGYRSELSSTPYQATARFLGSEESFEILSQETFSDAFLAGFSLSTDSVMGSARFGYDVEIADEGLIHFGGATLKLKF